MSFSKRKCRCSGFGDITDVLITILDTYSGSLPAESGLRHPGSAAEQGVRSLQGRFAEVAGASVVLVCLMIAENADGEPVCSRSSPNRGTITLVGEAVRPQVVTCDLFREDAAGTPDFADGDVCCSTC